MSDLIHITVLSPLFSWFLHDPRDWLTWPCCLHPWGQRYLCKRWRQAWTSPPRTGPSEGALVPAGSLCSWGWANLWLAHSRSPCNWPENKSTMKETITSGAKNQHHKEENLNKFKTLQCEKIQSKLFILLLSWYLMVQVLQYWFYLKMLI